MPKDFKEYCEDLYQNWKTNTNFFDEFSDDFETDYLPEPYLILKNGKKILYVLNYNPGGALPIQKREEFSNISTYEEAAKKMPEHYQEYSKIKNMLKFAENRCFDGVVDVETFFLHSKSIKTADFLKKYYKNGEGIKIVTEYLETLQAFLKDKPALAISGIGSRESISKEIIKKSAWIQLMCKTINLDLQKATFTPTSTKDRKVTSALLHDDENQKYLTVLMPYNIIPANAVDIN